MEEAEEMLKERLADNLIISTSWKQSMNMYLN